MIEKITLLSSSGCSCCAGYYNKLRNEFGSSVILVDASSEEGQKLLKEYDIKGLPTTIWNSKVVSGNIEPKILRKLLGYDELDDKFSNSDNTNSSDI